jgi:hypothetical protein
MGGGGGGRGSRVGTIRDQGPQQPPSRRPRRARAFVWQCSSLFQKLSTLVLLYSIHLRWRGSPQRASLALPRGFARRAKNPFEPTFRATRAARYRPTSSESYAITVDCLLFSLFNPPTYLPPLPSRSSRPILPLIVHPSARPSVSVLGSSLPRKGLCHRASNSICLCMLRTRRDGGAGCAIDFIFRAGIYLPQATRKISIS